MKKLVSHLIALVAVSLVVWVSGCGSLPHPNPNATMVIQTPWGPRLVPNPRANVSSADEAAMFAENSSANAEETVSLGKTNTIRVVKE